MGTILIFLGVFNLSGVLQKSPTPQQKQARKITQAMRKNPFPAKVKGKRTVD
jgi:hypothetical protein